MDKIKILFQGDSITDAGRDYVSEQDLHGYSLFVQEEMKDRFYCINRGVSGDTISLLLNRYEIDIKNVDFDILTILIGINDCWRLYDSNLFESKEEFYNKYKELMERVKKDHPKAKIIIMEPFLFPAEDKAHWRPHLIGFIDMARRIAREYADGYIPLDGLFARESFLTDWHELTGDGVHPSLKGHELIKKYLIEEINRVLKN